jgi:hypothetical protein
MTDVFLSYKREDQLRATQLVAALEKHGLSVWWDRTLTGGEQWRRSIETAIDTARCMVVLWSPASTGLEGAFVRDEAARGAARGILVPVLLGKTRPPLGFGELQAIDLSHWRGSARDPFLVDLVAVIRAKLEGRPVPASKGPMKRLLRRLTISSAVSALGLVGFAFATNTLGLQDRTCSLPLGQSWLSDACGAIGLGGRPTKDERIAWERRLPGSCEALREHLRRFPEGVYRMTANALLNARSVQVEQRWAPTAQHSLDLYVGRDAPPVAGEAAARESALARGRPLAERHCRNFVAAGSGLYRYKDARVEASEWQCTRITGGVLCGFLGQARCLLDERSDIERESCDASAAGK